MTNAEKGRGGAVLDIQLGHTAATPQTGLRVARILKYSSGGEGGGMKRREERRGEGTEYESYRSREAEAARRE